MAQLADARRTNQKLLALSELGGELDRVPGPERTAHEIARVLQRLTGCGLACIFSCAPGGEPRFKLIASAGPDAARLPANFQLGLELKIVSQAIASQTVLGDGDVGDGGESALFVLDGQVFPALIAAPLLRGDTLHGLILLASSGAQRFEAGDITLVTAARQQLLNTWEYAQQTEALTRFVQTVTMMSGIQEAGSLLEMIASIARRTLGAIYTLVATRSQQEWMMRGSGRAPRLYHSLGNGGAAFLEEAIKSPYTFRMRDLKNDPRSAVLQLDTPEMRTLLACPIRINGSTTGILLAFGKTGGSSFSEGAFTEGSFSEADVFLTELLVAHAAVNLESCYLNQELRANLKTTQLLYDLSLNISQAGSLTDAARAIALTAYRLLQARRCGLLLFSTNGAVEAEVHFPSDDPTIQHPYRLIQQAMDSRQTIFVAENENLTRSAIPIQTMRRCYGALWLEFPEDNEEARHPAEEIRILINQAAVALERSILLEETRQKANEIASAYDQLEQSYDQTLRALTRAQDVRDYDTERHSERVAEMAVRLGEEMGLSLPELKSLERGALLHDLGKIGVPDSILRKTGPLSPDEWDEMHKHPEKGAEIIQEIPALNDVLPVIANHHELWDGSGYPQHLRGEEIPLLARIFTVVDVFDAITSSRPYRTALSREDALEYLKSQAGKRYDAEVVTRFAALMQGATSNG
ncbi:MAG TPA: HD domain-containing phosphohydrolase [Anaerolineaceae bacterium]